MCAQPRGGYAMEDQVRQVCETFGWLWTRNSNTQINECQSRPQDAGYGFMTANLDYRLKFKLVWNNTDAKPEFFIYDGLANPPQYMDRKPIPGWDARAKGDWRAQLYPRGGDGEARMELCIPGNLDTQDHLVMYAKLTHSTKAHNGADQDRRFWLDLDCGHGNQRARVQITGAGHETTAMSAGCPAAQGWARLRVVSAVP